MNPRGLSKEEVEALAQMDQAAPGKALLKYIALRMQEKRTDYEEHPRVNNEDGRRDFRYVAGELHQLNEIATMPIEARQIINQQGGQKA